MLSSHLLGEAQEVCDRVGVINRGRIVTEATVAELRGGGRLLVRAEPIDIALTVATGIVGDDAVEVTDGALHLRIDPGRAPEIARALVTAGANLHELRPSERSLEEVFFEMTAPAEARQ
jgi:ABC-2 type transport system ATP-binding protein